ncbi:ATP-binding protein [Rummeliibacillus sp. NPDC094406]|uniref:ATP-binding protein n=1 Tax=Rummeliibacillus sp. NPDC094406 TaxID=3364511 RepID=UPI00381743A0
MKAISQALPKSIEMALTSNICSNHAKPVGMMIIEGVEICPACELAKENAAFAKSMSDQILAQESKKKKNTLYYKSIFADETLRNASFGKFFAESEEEVKNKDLAIQAFKHYKGAKVFTTLLQGDTGVGKSHLAMSILRNLNEKMDVECVFISVREMMTKIRDSFDNKESKYTQLYFVDMLSRVDFLCLDDLGAETGAIDTRKTATNFTLEVLTAIFEARQNKSTIITSNLSRKQMEDMYDKKLISRSFKNIAVIKFDNIRDKRIVAFDLTQEV